MAMAFDVKELTREEKYRLLLNCCRVVREITHRIDNMAFSMATIKHDAPDAALESSFDVIAPYVLSLMDSEDGLEQPADYDADMYDATYRMMMNWMDRRVGIKTPAM